MNKPLVLAAVLAGGLLLLSIPTSLQAARRGCGYSVGAYRAPQYRYYRAPAHGAYSSRPYYHGGYYSSPGGYYPHSGVYYPGATFSFGLGHGHNDFGHHYGHDFSHHGGHHGHH